MKIRRMITLVMCTMIGLFPLLPVDAATPSDTIKVQLLGLNDLHGKLDVTFTEGNVKYGRVDYLAAYLKQYEARNPDNTLIVHSGDMVGASSPVSALLQDEPTVDMMETMGVDVGAAGNHEFDEGVAELNRLVNGGVHPNGTSNYDGMNFPLLAANVEYKDSGKLVLPPYAIKEVGGVKIGFIGVATTATPNMIITTGNENLKFTDEATAINKYTQELQNQGIESIVVLAHVPGQQSGDTVTGEIATIANTVNDAVDVIFAAHNHIKLNGVVDNKLIVEAGEYGKSFSDVNLEIDPVTKDIVTANANIVDVVQANITPDAEVQAKLDNYLTQIGPIINEQVGEAAIAMDGGYASKGSMGDNALGNLIADGMKAAMNADFAMMNGGGIRDVLDAGPITWGELYNIQPFNNTLVQIDVTGSDLEKIVNAQISAWYGPDASIGGFRYTWDSATNKVLNLYLENGQEIEPDQTYTLTVNNFMYGKNNDSYRLRELGENPVTGGEDLQATVNFVKSFNEPIVYQPEGRISEIKNVSAELGDVTIAEAREAGVNNRVTIEGVVTTTPGAWGSKGFYIQDDEAGLYVFQNTISGIQLGQKIKITGVTSKYNGEFQLKDISQIKVLGEEKFPKAQIVQPQKINIKNEGQLVLLKNAVIGDLKKVNNYGTFEFTATKGKGIVKVRVDNRTGLDFDHFTFENGDRIDIAGISTQYNGEIQLKPRGQEDIAEQVKTKQK